MQELERLQKVLSQAGIASRRKSEEYILEGRVKVNGEVVTTLGYKVSKKDVVLFDDKPVTRNLLVYYVINKPLGYISTDDTKKDYKNVNDLLNIDDSKNRIFSIGMLDSNSTGAVILTNDGELAYNLNLSKKEYEKIYQARVDGIINQNDVTKLIKGIDLDNKKIKISNLEVISFDKVNSSTLIKFTIYDSKIKTVWKLLEEIGHPIKKLKRISFAEISIEGLALGSYRPLKPHEIKKLYSL